MTDLISRADAIEAVKETKPIVRSTERNWGKMIAEQHSKELVKALKALPSAEAVHKPDYSYEADMVRRLKESLSADAEWIPCSERLPDVGRDVLFSVADMYVAEGCIRADGDWTQFRWSAIQRKEEVTAWMPLPTPYKGGDTE